MGILYERIEALCQQRGITGYRLCKDIGISPNTMTELRKGRRDGVSAANAAKIAAYFGVSVEWLLGNEKTAAPEGDGANVNPRYFDLSPEDKATVDALIDRLSKAGQ